MLEGKFFLRSDSKPNELGEQMIHIMYCTQGVPCKKKTGISVKPEYWLGDNGTNRYIKEGPNGHPKAKLLNQRLTNIKKEYDNIIDKKIYIYSIFRHVHQIQRPSSIKQAFIAMSNIF